MRCTSFLILSLCFLTFCSCIVETREYCEIRMENRSSKDVTSIVLTNKVRENQATITNFEDLATDEYSPYKTVFCSVGVFATFDGGTLPTDNSTLEYSNGEQIKRVLIDVGDSSKNYYYISKEKYTICIYDDKAVIKGKYIPE